MPVMDEADFAALVYVAQHNADAESFARETESLLADLVPWLADKIADGHRPMAIWMALKAGGNIAVGLADGSQSLGARLRKAN